MLIRYAFELPIQVDVAGSIVKYQFETYPGDIEFGVSFLTRSDGQVASDDTITSCRVPSDLETISGQFRAPSEGVILFRWNNDYSWFTTKQLSYLIEMGQPSFSAADSRRSAQARTLLHNLVSENYRCETLLVEAEKVTEQLDTDISIIEDQISKLAELLKAKSSLQDKYLRDCENLEDIIERNNSRKLGLCLRMLNKQTLALIFDMVPGSERGKYAAVCKYWKAIICSPKSPSSHKGSAPPLK